MNHPYHTLLFTTLAITVSIVVANTNEIKHFNPKGKLPSEYTIKKQQALRKSLPFEDKRDFEEQKKGLIAVPPFMQIKKDDGSVVWDMDVFKFLLQGDDFDSIHPSCSGRQFLT